MAENKRLSILIITEFIPYPLDRGGKICVFNFLDFLRSTHHFTLFVPCYNHTTKEEAKQLQEIWPDVTIELVDFVTPKKVKPELGFFPRVLHFIKRRVDGLIGKMSVDKSDRSKLDFSIPFRPHSQAFLNALQKVCLDTDFDIIHVQLARNLNLISALPQKPKKIFEQIESQFDVIKDYARTKNLEKGYANYLVKNSETLENGYINLYDAVFTLNEIDAAYFNKNLTNPIIFSSPFGVLNKDVLIDPPFSSTPNKLIFLGVESHHPNPDALEWYLKNIHKNIYEKHKLVVHVIGTWSDKSKEYFTKLCPGVKFEGVVENYSEILKQSIMIVPIRIGGGGLRSKILYAMANAVPVVTTSIGAFGITGNDNEHFCIADSDVAFFEAISNLITDKKNTERLCRNAFALISEKYTQTKTSELRNKYYMEIVSK